MADPNFLVEDGIAKDLSSLGFGVGSNLLREKFEFVKHIHLLMSSLPPKIAVLEALTPKLWAQVCEFGLFACWFGGAGR